MAEREFAEADALRIGSARGGVCERLIQQCVRRRIAGVPVVHPGGGEPEHADRRTGRLGVLLEQHRRLMGDEMARHGRWRPHVHPVGPLFERVDGHLLLVVARGPSSRDHAVFPGVPRAHYELAMQAALGQRAAFMVAAIGDGAEQAVVEKDRDLMAARGHRDWCCRSQPSGCADPVPRLPGVAHGVKV